MREIRPSGSEGGGAELNRSSLPLSDVRGARTDWQSVLQMCEAPGRIGNPS
jgi:hypothetical protein